MCPTKEKNIIFYKEKAKEGFRLVFLRHLSQKSSLSGKSRLKRGTGIFLLISFLLTASGVICHATSLLPWNVLRLPSGDRAIVVDKSSQHLYLLFSDKGHLEIEKHVICATGQKDGVKEKAGDRRTPEGIYFIKGLLLPPRLEPKYGICALPLNYPNLIDRRLKRDGDGIWIHGIHKNRLIKSTHGCVVLQNEDLAYLAKHIHPYTTPVVIVSHTKLVPAITLFEEEEKELSFLEKWRKAWASGDIEAYIACYSPAFRAKGMNLIRWREYKSSLFKRYHNHMIIQIQDPLILHMDKYNLITFKQRFQGGRFHAEGYKRLYLIRKGDDLKIVGEEWIPHATVAGSLSSYGQKVALIKPLKKEFRIVSLVTMAPASPMKKRNLFQKARGFLDRWKTLWEKREIGPFSSLYSRRFRFKSMDFQAWKRYKRRTFLKNGPIHITLRDITFRNSNGKLIIAFHQTYRSRAFRDSGRKELVLSQESGHWKIIQERWSRGR